MTNNDIDTEVFIPLTPGKKQRVGMLISNSLPGFLLVLAVIGNDPGTVGALLFNAFCFISGILVVFFSIQQFRLHWKGNPSRADMVTVLTGLLLIAQGALIFDAAKEFQPAHLYFIASAMLIFKGVMFPEAKIRRGFIISSDKIAYTSGPFRKNVLLPATNISDVVASGNKIVFHYTGEETTAVKIWGSINNNGLAAALKQELLHKEETSF
ncbi:MAG: hypothetical protein M3Q95_05030 [Bacteroidota bacterium]|nr:hypothetical protein [Bacteroidota bacterium]